MHERKQKMAELADAFIALPGGFGTLEELAEIITWVQLSLVNSPVGLLNTKGYYNHLLAQMDIMRDESFTSAANRNILKSHEQPEELLSLLLGNATGKNGKTDLNKS